MIPEPGQRLPAAVRPFGGCREPKERLTKLQFDQRINDKFVVLFP